MLKRVTNKVSNTCDSDDNNYLRMRFLQLKIFHTSVVLLVDENSVAGTALCFMVKWHWATFNQTHWRHDLRLIAKCLAAVTTFRWSKATPWKWTKSHSFGATGAFQISRISLSALSEAEKASNVISHQAVKATKEITEKLNSNDCAQPDLVDSNAVYYVVGAFWFNPNFVAATVTMQ